MPTPLGDVFQGLIKTMAGRPGQRIIDPRKQKNKEADKWDEVANVPIPKQDLQKPDLQKIDDIW